MRRLLVISSIVIIAYVNGYVLPPVPDLRDRIVGGDPINITQTPYQVAVHFKSLGVSSVYCGGSILSTTVVLSAARCTYNTGLNEWAINAGSSNNRRDGQWKDVFRIVHHPDYDNKNETNDIVLLFLESPLTLTNGVALVQMPEYGQLVADGSMGDIAGWGAVNEGGSYVEYLRAVKVPIVNQRRCAEIYANQNRVTGNMLCAGAEGRAACTRDYGSPLIVNKVQIGIYSWSRGCGLPDYPMVLTRVPNYVYWIRETMQS